MDIGKLKYKSLLFVSTHNDEALTSTLNEIFKEVFIEKEPNDAVTKYFGKDRTSDAEIDLVLYDVDENNIITLKQIRDMNTRIPLFVISEDYSHVDANLLSQQRIYHSFSKPLDKDAFSAQVYYALKEVSKRKFNAYLKQVAIVSKTDINAKIIFVNELFCETSGYSKEELIDQQHNIVRHPSTPKSFYSDMWKTLQAGTAWHGVVKNQSKSGEEYYLNATIFPVFNSKKEIIGYLNISFEVTNEEQNKAKLKHYIMSQKSAQIKEKQEFEHKVQERVEQAIVNEKAKFNELKKVAYNLEDVLNQTKVSRKKLALRVQYLEDFIKKVQEKDKNAENQLKHLIKESRQQNYETSKKNEKLEKSNEKLTEKLEKAQESIKIFQGYIDDYRKKIDDLNDIITNYEKEKK